MNRAQYKADNRALSDTEICPRWHSFPQLISMDKQPSKIKIYLC
jgi:hypothetical protein